MVARCETKGSYIELAPPKIIPVNFPKVFEIAGRAPWGGSPFSKVTGEISTFRKLYPVDWFLPKISSSRNFEKSPFDRICRLTAYRLQCHLKLTPKQISYRSFENFEKYRGKCL